MAYPRFQLARTFKQDVDTAGNLTLNSTSWATVDAARARLTLEGVQVDDVIMACLDFSMNNEAVTVQMDFATIVSSTITNYFSTGTATPATNGMGGMFSVGSAFKFSSSVAFLTLVSGDISSDSVEVALVYKTDSATNRTLRASSGNTPLVMSIHNLGPIQPT